MGSPTTLETIKSLDVLQGLTVFRSIYDALPSSTSPWELIHRLLQDRHLAATPEFYVTPDPWEAWLIHRVLSDENPWTLRIAKGMEPSALVDRIVRADLARLNEVRGVVRHVLETHAAIDVHALPPPATPPDVSCDGVPHAQHRRQVAEALANNRDWRDVIPLLRQFYAKAKVGVLNTAAAFRLDEGELVPVFEPDPIRLEQLTGYDSERQRVIANTERLIAGLPAHNLLLYGDRGTGKSATVKALVHRFIDEGLKVIEIAKSDVSMLHDVVRRLSRLPVPCIVFIDDLSFEEAETEYKQLKAALEGSLEKIAANVCIYATSNRRHLITERFSDRRDGAFGDASDEVRSQDGMQEKLSLADRFGQTIIFPTPSQQAYLDIVYALADQEGITLPKDELREMALRWATWQNGRSARTARQFVDSLIG